MSIKHRNTKQNSGTVNRKILVKLAVLAFPLFLSVDLSYISNMLDNAINAWKVTSFFILAYSFTRHSMSNPIRVHLFIFLLLMAILFISTLLNKGSFTQYLIIWGGFFGVVLFVELYINTAPREMLIALKIVLGVLVVLNAITAVAFPDGMRTIVRDEGWRVTTEGYWLLGHRNNFGTPILAALLACAVSDMCIYKKLRLSSAMVALASLISVIVTWSATSVVTTVLAVTIIVAIGFNARLNKIKPIPLVIGYAAIDIGIVVFDIQRRFSSFIENVLHRSADLTGRVQLWDIVKSKIPESPIIGHGIQLSGKNGLTEYNRNYVHAHNGELDIIYNGGFLCLICYGALILTAASRCAKYWDSPYVRLSYFILILIMVHAITGLFFSSYACMVLWLCLNAEVLCRLSMEATMKKNE